MSVFIRKHLVAQGGAFERQKLTKGFLMLAPAGKFLVSNCGQPPTFAEVVAPLRERLPQWKRIVRAQANGRLCMVFETAVQYNAWRRSIVGNADLN